MQLVQGDLLHFELLVSCSHLSCFSKKRLAASSSHVLFDCPVKSAIVIHLRHGTVATLWSAERHSVHGPDGMLDQFSGVGSCPVASVQMQLSLLFVDGTAHPQVCASIDFSAGRHIDLMCVSADLFNAESGTRIVGPFPLRRLFVAHEVGTGMLCHRIEHPTFRMTRIRAVSCFVAAASLLQTPFDQRAILGEVDLVLPQCLTVRCCSMFLHCVFDHALRK